MTTLEEPLSIRALLDGALRQARRHIYTIYPAVAVPMALLAGALPFTQEFWLPGFANPDTPPDPALIFANIGTLFALSAALMVVYVLAHATLAVGAVQAIAGGSVSMSAAWTSMLRPRALATLALVYLTIMVGMMCCLLPGIYVALLWSMIVPVMAAEQRFLIDGLGHAADLARYNPRKELSTDPRVRAFLVYLAGLLATYAVSFVVQLPLAVIQQVMVFRGMAGGEHVNPMAVTARLLWLQVPTAVVASLAQTAMQLFTCFGIAMLYFDVRRRREGQDLEAAVSGLERAAPADPPAGA